MAYANVHMLSKEHYCFFHPRMLVGSVVRPVSSSALSTSLCSKMSTWQRRSQATVTPLLFTVSTSTATCPCQDEQVSLWNGSPAGVYMYHMHGEVPWHDCHSNLCWCRVCIHVCCTRDKHDSIAYSSDNNMHPGPVPAIASGVAQMLSTRTSTMRMCALRANIKLAHCKFKGCILSVNFLSIQQMHVFFPQPTILVLRQCQRLQIYIHV